MPAVNARYGHVSLSKIIGSCSEISAGIFGLSENSFREQPSSDGMSRRQWPRMALKELFQMNNAVADGGQNCARAILNRQLGKDIFEMRFNRVLGNE